ncbi:unnamed protein product [Pieris macdunnoughi]|uniref:ETS domain-containing protein n=1 Tax=Pieris macdunnoughi TaxID=345717 RepID=A0A821QEV5_9NEOP|nr:unnamed protein product [Pieris macdunnoughi]
MPACFSVIILRLLAKSWAKFYLITILRFVKPDEVAKLWGQMKQNENMTFEKFSRAMRYHYRQSVLVSVPTARLVYQFGHKGPDFRTDNPNFIKVKSELDVHDMNYSNS